MGFWMIVILANLIIRRLCGADGRGGISAAHRVQGPLGMGVPEDWRSALRRSSCPARWGSVNYKKAGNFGCPVRYPLEHRQPQLGAVLGVEPDHHP